MNISVIENVNKSTPDVTIAHLMSYEHLAKQIPNRSDFGKNSDAVIDHLTGGSQRSFFHEIVADCAADALPQKIATKFPTDVS